ncbi:heterokaryon incompatibility protein-domain-containing protein [Fusarium oxysporum]|nr:heterokaryon incompatibility protein-domain-containing protein [Fusarium oxysporum]
MGLCNACTQGLRNVYQQRASRPNHGFKIVHAPHNQDTCQACWICHKYSIWLEDHYPETLHAWRSAPLYSIFRYDSEMITPKDATPEENWRIVSLGFTVQPLGFSSQDATLGVSVRLMSDQEYRSYATGGPEVPQPTSRLHLVGIWLTQCMKTHSRCATLRNRRSSWYPTRLLLLGPGHSDVRLIISASHDMQGPYMTLSHRWGSFAYTKLTSSTLESFKNGIDVNNLPVPFKETIHIARLAGIKYLWIDSLCIKQDEDKRDWRVEAQLMDKVYSHSFLNVSATLADNDTRSLFDQSGHPFDPISLPLPYMKKARVFRVGSPRTKLKMLQQRWRRTWIVDNELWDDDIENAPLQSRGWVFQERFLSPRILHFAERQIAWECGEISALEMFPKRVPPGLLKASRKDVIDNLLSAKAITNDNLIDFRRTWDDTVHKYTKTDLTFSNDKLIAFAGLAKAIEGLRNDTYLAGLWKSAFIYQLAWTRTRYDAVQQPLELSSGRAPSWSWLSVDGEILLSQAQKPRKHFASVVELPDTNCAGSSAIAASGSVLLQGSLLPIDSIEWDDDVLSEFNISGLTLKDGWTFNDTHLDLEGTKEQILQLQKSGIALLPLFATDEHMQCIAVTGINVPGSMSVVFRRVGACQIEYRKLHIPNQGSQEGWIEDPSTVFLPGEPSHNLLHPVARSVIRIAEVNIALDSRLIRLI